MSVRVGLLLLVPLLAGCLGGNGGDDGPGNCKAGEPGCAPPCEGQACPPVCPTTGCVVGDPPCAFEPGGCANATSGAPREWVQPGAADIRPGVRVYTDGGQCTSNFVFTSLDNATVYLGVAAHCLTREDPNQAENGCDPASEPMPVGEQVEVVGARAPATIAYSSWATMQDIGENGQDACQHNDFALLQLHPADANRTNPSLLFFGGPERPGGAGNASLLEKVLTYGDSGLRQGVAALSPHEGYVVRPEEANGWSTSVFTVTPGVPGDSGSAVLLEDGTALGVLVTIHYVGATNGVSSLDRLVGYAREHGGLPVRLATWDLATTGRLP